MNPTEYTIEALKTVSSNKEVIKERIKESILDTLHGAIGGASEMGEILSNVKAHVYYGKPLDINNIIEESGDTLWFLNLLLHSVGSSLEEAMEKNIQKLRKRYGESFSEEKALNRNIENELSHFEVK